MATVKKNVKQPLLLEAPLEALHAQSREWIEDLEFMKDECAFLYTLIRNAHNSPLLKTSQARTIERALLQISNQRIEELTGEINGHENFLAAVIEGKSRDEVMLRRRHRIISNSTAKLEKDFRKLKRQIFGLVKIKGESVLQLSGNPKSLPKKLRLAKA